MKKSKKVSKEVKKDKTNIILIIAIIIVGILLAGVSYAFFSSSDTSTSKIVKSGSLKIEYIDSSDNIDSIDTIPILDSEIKTKANKIEFNVSNTGSRKAYVDISLIDIVMDSELVNLEFKWALYSGDTKINNGNFRNVLDNKQLLMNNIEINSSATKTYQLYIWISENGLDQSNTMDKEFKCKIEIIGNLKEGAKLLSQVIKENNSPIVTTKPNFANVATTDVGLVQDVDKDGETYYFRGDVKDNYLKIDGLTDSNNNDMLFRIVRINGSGTIRIIKEKIIGKSAFNSKNVNEKYVGYTYDNSSPNVQDGTDSTIKKYIEDWYNNVGNNIIKYDGIFASERYCNDTSVSSADGNNIYYKAFSRSTKPTFICPKTEKTYGGEYDLKVGLLTVDEATFAGGRYSYNNSSYYLAGQSWWYVGSPAMNVVVYYFFDKGIIHGSNVNYADGSVRPVINLKSDTLYYDGDGTVDNPYIIKNR